MPVYSKASKERLDSCHPELQVIFNEVIKIIDCIVMCGFRNEEEQNKAYAEGKSKLKFPFGNHNRFPSLAVDVYPYPVDFKDTKRFYYFAGLVRGIIMRLQQEGKVTHEIIWGGDWDGDHDLNDQKFNDLVHWEIKL